MNEMAMTPVTCDNRGMCSELQRFESMLKDIINDLIGIKATLTGNDESDNKFPDPMCVKDSIVNIGQELETCLDLTMAIKKEF